MPPPQGYGHQPALFHSESMEEDCACEGNRDSFPDSKSSNTLTKGCHETPLLVSAAGHGDPETLLGTANPAQELGTHQYRHQPAPGFRNKVPSRGKAPCCPYRQLSIRAGQLSIRASHSPSCPGHRPTRHAKGFLTFSA